MSAPGLGGGRSKAIAVAFTTLAVAGCGTSDGPDLKDASDGRPFRVSATASFPERQHLSHTATMRITVRNDDSRPLPAVAVVLQGLQRRIDAGDNGLGEVRDPRRPIWVIDVPPVGAATSYRDTWSLGRLAPGASRTFTWRLTPSVAGTRDVRWSVAGAVEDQGPVQAASGSTSSGTFRVKVLSTPPDVTIDENDQVVSRDEN